MCRDIGIWYAPASVLRGEDFDGAEAIRQLEMWLIQQHGYQGRYAISELTEKNFCRIGRMYEHCRKKYGAVGTFMSVYYRSKKGKKTEKDVQEAEAEIVERAYAEVDWYGSLFCWDIMWLGIVGDIFLKFVPYSNNQVFEHLSLSGHV